MKDLRRDRFCNFIMPRLYGANKNENIIKAMSSSNLIPFPLSIPSEQKRETRSQFGALCYRVVDEKIQILLITSRRTKRWIIPKGWPENGMTPAEIVSTEASEEAGVRGKLSERPIGVYCYEKMISGEASLPCIVTVYPLKVKNLDTEYKEKNQRSRKWFTRKQAARRVDEPDLAALIKSTTIKGLKT